MKGITEDCPNCGRNSTVVGMKECPFCHTQMNLTNRKDGICDSCNKVGKMDWYCRHCAGYMCKKCGKEDKHIILSDKSTTVIAKATKCCGGSHQTIAGALLKSEYWKRWYDHASKNQLFDVDETCTIDAMSDEHFAEFMKFSAHPTR